MIEKIGRGGMATVWKARQLSLDRIVAIKVLASDFSQHEQDVLRFQSEAQAAAKLKHNGIVQVYDASVTEGRYYFVMEYIGGYSVGEWCRRKGQLAEEDILLISECVGVALNHAWTHAKIIHCDIKPDNVLIDADGTAKVADLGLARTLTAASASTSGDAILGTPNYISPEQASGVLDLDARTDIYSLGASMYQMATGRMLFSSERSEDIMEMQVTRQDSNCHELNPALSTGMCDLIGWMLMKDRNERPANWDAVLVAIDRVKRGKLPATSPLPTGRSTLKSRKAATLPTRKAATPDKLDSTPIREPSKMPAVVVGLVLALVIGVLATCSRTDKAPGVLRKTMSTTTTTSRPPPTIEQTPDLPLQRARAAFENVMSWAGSNADQLLGIEERLNGIRNDVSGTEVARRLDDALVQNADAQREALDMVMSVLRGRTAAALRDGRFEEARRVYETYEGVYAELSAAARSARAQEIRAQGESPPDPPPVQADPDVIMQGVESRLVRLLRADRLMDATRLLKNASGDARLVSRRKDLIAGAGLLHAAQQLDISIIKSFGNQKGQIIDVQLKTGSTRVEVQAVRDGSLWVVDPAATGGKSFSIGVDALSTREVLRRLGADERPAVALRKGLMALKARAYSQAKRYFERIGTYPAAVLQADVEAAMQGH